VELTAAPLRNNAGEVIAILSIVRDIRERKNFEQQLIEAKQKAEESDRLKSAFLANMSHEIRTPMNGIVGFSNILKRQELSKTKRDRFINIINNSAEQLLNIINDIIDISKLETGQQKILQEEFELNEMLKETHTLFRSQAKEKDLKLILHQGLPSDQSRIQTDKTKLQQILHNLIGNALKFTQRGRVEFGYEKDTTQLHFYVRDTGKGIPEEMHGKIFERFMQVYDQESVALGGTGLGLSICKGLVELLGGSIDVQSEPGAGTMFQFDIPYQTATSSKSPDSNAGTLAPNKN
jgi:signal transduction histidine kinase